MKRVFVRGVSKTQRRRTAKTLAPSPPLCVRAAATRQQNAFSESVSRRPTAAAAVDRRPSVPFSGVYINYLYYCVVVVVSYKYVSYARAFVAGDGRTIIIVLIIIVTITVIIVVVFARTETTEFSYAFVKKKKKFW